MPYSPSAIRAMTRSAPRPPPAPLCIDPALLSLTSLFPLPSEMVFHTALDGALALDARDLAWFDALDPEAACALIEEVEATRCAPVADDVFDFHLQGLLHLPPAVVEKISHPPHRTPSPPLPPSRPSPSLPASTGHTVDTPAPYSDYIHDGPYITPPSETAFVPNIVARAQTFTAASPSPITAPVKNSPDLLDFDVNLVGLGDVDVFCIAASPTTDTSTRPLSASHSPSPLSSRPDDELKTPPTPSSPLASPTGPLGVQELLNAGPTPVRRTSSMGVAKTDSTSMLKRVKPDYAEFRNDGLSDRDADGESELDIELSSPMRPTQLSPAATQASHGAPSSTRRFNAPRRVSAPQPHEVLVGRSTARPDSSSIMRRSSTKPRTPSRGFQPPLRVSTPHPRSGVDLGDLSPLSPTFSAPSAPSRFATPVNPTVYRGTTVYSTGVSTALTPHTPKTESDFADDSPTRLSGLASLPFFAPQYSLNAESGTSDTTSAADNSCIVSQPHLALPNHFPSRALYAPAASWYTRDAAHAARYPQSSLRDEATVAVAPPAHAAQCVDTESFPLTDARSNRWRPQKKFSDKCEMSPSQDLRSAQTLAPTQDAQASLQVKQEMLEGEPSSAERSARRAKSAAVNRLRAESSVGANAAGDELSPSMSRKRKVDCADAYEADEYMPKYMTRSMTAEISGEDAAKPIGFRTRQADHGADVARPPTPAVALSPRTKAARHPHPRLYTEAENAIILSHFPQRGTTTVVALARCEAALAEAGYMRRTSGAIKFHVRNTIWPKLDREATGVE